jgi:hypothetical protein
MRLELGSRFDCTDESLLAQGDPWERREVLIPIGAVVRVEADAVTLSLTKDDWAPCRR